MNPGVVLFVLLIVLSFLGIPIFLAIGLATIAGLSASGLALEAIVQKTFLGLNSASLLAIPFFILAGNLMSKGITGKLINVSNALLGWVKGSLGAVTVLASAMFGAISGSAVATVSAVGGTTIPAMKKEGNKSEYAGAIVASSSMLGPLVPPSISLIVYASLTDTSVQKLFFASFTPAIITAALFIVYALYYGKKNNLPSQMRKSAKEILLTFKDSIWALLMPVIILGGIFSGIYTVTEAAAISVIYALVINLFVYRCLTLKDLYTMIYDAAISTATIMILVGLSKASSYLVIASQLPQQFMELMGTFTSSKIVVLLIINVIFLILGCMMEGNSALVMMVPLLLTLVQSYQMDLIQFGVLVSLNLYIGCMTPPVGLSLLLGCKLSETSVGATFKYSLPFLIITLGVLALVTFVPQFTLWLPSLMK